MYITTAGLRALTAVVALSVAPTLSAAPITFAQFVMDVASNSFVWDNQGNGTSTFTASSQVDFKFDNVPVHPALQGFQDATLTLTASTTSNAQFLGGIVIQGGVSGTIMITRNTAFMGENLLLRVDFVNGNLFGQEGGSGAQFGSSTPPPGAVIFSSDFLNFGNTSARDFSLSLSSVFPFLGSGPGNPSSPGGSCPPSRTPAHPFCQVRDFTGAATGTFSSEPTPLGEVPEPGTLAMLGGGLLSLSWIRLRRR